MAGKRYYFYNVPVPAGRTGKAVLYTRWQREDSGREGFYNCSDIVLEGPGVEYPWHEKDVYIKQGFEPKSGEQVHFRVMGHQASGAELVDEKLPITTTNASTAVWAEQLARKLNSQHAMHVAVGVREGNQIHYDATNYERNMVFVKNAGDSVSMSIIPGEEGGIPGNPVAKISGNTTVEVGKILNLSGTGSEGRDLTYVWSAPGFTPSTSTASEVALTAPGTAGSRNVSLTVHDAQNRTHTDTVAVNVTAGAGGGTCTVTAWSSSKTYATYAEQVSYQGKVYRQNFWNVNKQPDLNNAAYGKEWVFLHDCP